MVIRKSELTIKPEKTDEFLAFMKSFDMSQVTGYTGYISGYLAQINDSKFNGISIFEDQAADDAFTESEFLKTNSAKLVEFINGTPSLTVAPVVVTFNN